MAPEGGGGAGLPVEVVHGVAGVAGDLVETLAPAHRLLNGVLVVEDLVVWGEEPGVRAGFGAVGAGAGPEAGLPFMVTLTPEARKRPPKRLLKIWLPSNVAVAWLVISIPEGGGTGQSRHPIMSKA